jgi:hypothetical protein
MVSRASAAERVHLHSEMIMVSRRPILAFPTMAVVLASACADEVAGPARVPTRPHAEVSPSAITSVMHGLDSPRGLAFGPEGGLYVAEAGTTQLGGACGPYLEGAQLATKCWSGSGSISRLWRGRQERIATGLPSTFVVESGLASGPQDISITGRGHALVAVGWGGPPQLRGVLGGDATQAGTIVQLEPSGVWRVVADIAAFEADNNPAGGPVDSNPYGVLAEPGRAFVVDAGGNSLLEVAANGRVSLVATFPRIAAPPPFNSTDAVPTRVRRGPDGALYVSTLSGAPFAIGSAAIYVVRPGQPPVVYAGGFKTITDFAFASDGGLYVLQYATGPMFFSGPGALIRVAPDGTRNTITTALSQPTGLAIGSDGSVYVSNRGGSSGIGEVLRITP